MATVWISATSFYAYAFFCKQNIIFLHALTSFRFAMFPFPCAAIITIFTQSLHHIDSVERKNITKLNPAKLCFRIFLSQNTFKTTF